MSTAAKPASTRILVVRLGAMGDIIHALPAVASLKTGFPGSRLTWIVEPKWAPLLEDNPFIDRLVLLRRDTLAGVVVTVAHTPPGVPEDTTKADGDQAPQSSFPFQQ